MVKKSGESAAKRLDKSIPKRLPNVWILTDKATRTLWDNRHVFLGIIAVYGILSLILVQSASGTSDVANLKHQLNLVFTGHLGSLASGFGVFVLLLGSGGAGSNQAGSGYQFMLVLIASLAIIWALRQVSAGIKFRARDAYYKGMFPLIPYILVLIVIGLQLIPLLIGSTLYAIVSTNGIAVHFVEQFLWVALFIGLAGVTLYFLSSSLFALYIVTLPDMTPIKSLRSARELTQNRRWTVLLKILFLPVILLVASGIIMIPVIIWLTTLSQLIFFILTLIMLAVAHSYMYALYRELLE
ncbi:MAG TPA: hypothetical protein VLF79_03095 [Candidatus Saccharimonadales bacterium]|nr:hypothetical protein [Candidatus Saccharimonadales bacterium]